MRNACRPTGRFFCLLMVMAALILALRAGMQAAPPAGGPAMTQVADTVYRADGAPATGTVLISWPAFTTADGKAVAAGSLNVALGSGGAFTASLAPNTGAQPAGVYYKVIYQLSGQQPSTEYGVVPATGSTSIGSVRAKLMPPTVAAQVLTRDVADTNYVHVTGDQTMNGVVTFTTPPSVPTPQNPGDAANKGYVDTVASASVNLASPAPIGSATPNTGAFTLLNGTANAAAYPGLDCGAKINNALAAGVSEVWLTTAAGTACTTAVTVGAGQSLKFVQNGMWTFSQPITLGQTASLVGLPKGTNNASVILKEANGANLAYLVNMAGGQSALQDIYLDGNYANNPTAQDVVWVNNADRVAFHGVGMHHGKRYGVYVSGASSCCGRFDKSSIVADNYNSNLYFAGTTNSSASDWIIETAEFENSVIGYGIEAVNAATARLNNNDIGGNKAGGIRITTTSSGVANAWMLSTTQFGNNGGNDLFCDGTAGGLYSASGHVIVGSAFMGLGPGTTGNTYDSIHLHNCGQATITGNFFAGGGSSPYRYHYFSDQTLGQLSSVLAGNTFNQGGAATADLNPESLDRISGNNISNQAMFERNLTLGNNYPMYCLDETGANWVCFLAYQGSNYFVGNPNTSSAGKYTLLFQPNGNGQTSFGMYGTGTGTGANFRFANGTTLQWLDHLGTSHAFASVDSSDHTYIMGNLAGDLQFQPTAGTTEGTLTAANGLNLVHGLQIGGNTVVDSSRNATVQNLTVNGTCTGCGGGGGNLSSPGPIGNTAPNTGAFTTLSAQMEGKRYKVEGFPSSCTVNSVAYTTQFDCAFQTAYYAAQTQAASQTLELGNAVYLTNVGLQQSSVYVVNIIGAAKTDTTEGLNGGSVIRMNATISNPVVTLPKLATAPLRSSLVYRDFVIDANHKAPVCLDASSLRDSFFGNIACENATGSNYWVRFGDSSGTYGQNYDMQIGPIKIVSPYAYSALADVTANVVGGAISTSGYTVNSGGTGYLNGPTVTAYLTGYGAGANPCAVMPTGLRATVAGNVVTSVSSSTGASGCSGNVYVRVPDLPAAAYGFKNEFTTDSTFTDIIVEGVGNVAAIYDAGNAANVWMHAHPWQYQPVGVESHGAGWWWGLQCDSMVHYCVDFEGSNGSPHLFNTLVIDQPAGASMYYLGAGVLDGTTRDDYAPGAIPADWHRFVSYAVGPVNESVTNFQNYFPANFQASGFQSYNAPAAEKFDYHGFGDQYIFGDVKSQTNFKDIATHFATTNIVNGSLLQGFSDNATTRKWLIDSSTGNATVNNLTINGICTGCGAGGSAYGYYVSKYANIQAAIDAVYNNGSVQAGGVVIDDRTSPYLGPGFIVRDSVTLKLAPTTYTITSTVTNNNGVSNVTAGIISMPGSHIVGSGTSANHGTNVNAGAGLNADLIATSTVGTGAGANAQWWHWGSIENFHMDGNKANQTAGRCINIENMGETAVLRALEVGNCYSDNIRLEGNFATQSEISDITVNSAGQYGVNLDNFQGVGVLRGLSGDSNATSIIRFNGSQSATLTVLGLKSEEETSGQDPLITIDMPTDGSQPALSIEGGYTYARPGVKDVIKIINGKTGAAPFVTVTNFYVDANFVNAVNDTVNSRTFAAANMNKVPFSYLPTGSYQSGQAFTFAPGTFIQGGSSALTEIFGSSTDGSSMIAAQGNGDGTSYYTGGLKIGIPNRTQFGQPPEMMARMGSRFLGAGQGYDTNTWVFVPIWKSGDSSNRWIGEPNQRWPEVYAGDVNATTATVGTLNVTNCTGCGSGGGGVTSFNSRTGTVVPAANDYSFSQISGSLSHSQLPTLLSADIPNNTANTTGSAGSLSGASALPNGTTATTQAANNNSTQVATTAYADAGDAGKVNRATVTAYGACGDATHVCQVTTNSQGLVTNETAVTITAAAPTIGFATQTGGSLSTTTTNYVTLGAGAAVNATETYLQVPIARAGTISNCRARLTASQTAGNGWIFTIRKNGTACAGISMACVGAQTCSDTSNTCSLAAGDLIDIQATVSGSPSTSAVYGTCLFQ